MKKNATFYMIEEARIANALSSRFKKRLPSYAVMGIINHLIIKAFIFWEKVL
jgi:hypothetical protein